MRFSLDILNQKRTVDLDLKDRTAAKVFVSTFTDGFTKVLLISDTDESSHNHSSNSLLKTAVKEN